MYQNSIQRFCYFNSADQNSILFPAIQESRYLICSRTFESEWACLRIFFFCYFVLQLYYQDYELKQRNGRVTNMTRHISWFGWRIKRSYLLRYERTGSKICGFLFFLELLSCKQRNGDRSIPVLAGMLPGVGRSDMDWQVPYENECRSCNAGLANEWMSTRLLLWRMLCMDGLC